MNILIDLVNIFVSFCSYVFLQCSSRIDSKLKFDVHINGIVTRAHQRAGCIFRCFLSRDVDWLVKAFVTYVRPIVEYASPV